MGWRPFAGAVVKEDSLEARVTASGPWGLLVEMVDRFVGSLTPLPQVAGRLIHGQRLRDPEVRVATLELEPRGERLLEPLTLSCGTVQPFACVSAWGLRGA
ncbi:MAG: hypothetical protein HY812_00640 [Planctomycetes bacterium]|nr:hypothetical protein [Planctomycetota bacterium]